MVPTHKIRKGQQLYRVLTVEYDDNGERRYTALDPNPFTNAFFDLGSNSKARYVDGTLVPGRFAPFRDKDGEPQAVPALYCAESAIGAYYEALLRPLDKKQNKSGLQKRSIDLIDVQNKVLARLVLKSNLNLADCRRTYLKDGNLSHWPYTYAELYSHSNLKVLHETRSLAKIVHDKHPSLDGLIWDSVQAQGPVTCIILFGSARAGKVEEEISVLDDFSTWKPYLLDGVRNGEIIVGLDLINRLDLSL